jgi:hypothetical protein
MQNELGKLPPPPRLMTAFMAGFDAIANHVTIIALPVLVDLFLWLGPHLKLDRFFEPWLVRLQEFNIPVGSVSAADLESARQTWMELITRLNLFSILRTFPVGPASLMSLRMPVETPLGTPLTLQPTSFFAVAGWGLLIVLVGWIVGSLYFYAVSGVALDLPRRSMFLPMLQVVLLSLVWIAALIVISIPLLFIFTLLNLISPVIAQGALILVAMLALWLILPVFFSPHGIFIGSQGAFSAIRSSLKMVRYTLPTSGLFLMGFILISQGLDFLWRTPPEMSWWTLVGIAGHAFISTALLAASFVYYRDVNAWLTAILDQLKKQKPASVNV